MHARKRALLPREVVFLIAVVIDMVGTFIAFFLGDHAFKLALIFTAALFVVGAIVDFILIKEK